MLTQLHQPIINHSPDPGHLNSNQPHLTVITVPYKKGLQHIASLFLCIPSILSFCYSVFDLANFLSSFLYLSFLAWSIFSRVLPHRFDLCLANDYHFNVSNDCYYTLSGFDHCLFYHFVFDRSLLH